METIKDIFADIYEIERTILGEEQFQELLNRYTMKHEAKRDEQREVYNWDER